jgi:hypothetical protein
VEIIERAVERIYDLERTPTRISMVYMEVFFLLEQGVGDKSVISDKQDHFLKSLIERRNNDIGFIEFLFRVIADFSDERRLQLIGLFLKYNKKFEDFERLSLEPTSRSWSGSAVPMLQGRVAFYESLLPLLNTAELLKHKQYVEQSIQRIRLSIEREKKNNFMEV